MNTVRQLVHSVRYERLGVRIGGPGATLQGHWWTVIVSMIVVFACFFALGRASRVSDASHAEMPSTLQAASVRAGIPVGLAGGPLLGGAVPIARRTSPRVTRPTRSSAARANPSAAALGQSFTAETPQAAVAPAPQEATSAPAPAPAPPASSTHSSSQHSSSQSSSGGGSFDSSE